MSKPKNPETSDDPESSAATSRRVGVYDKSDDPEGGGGPPGKIGVYDRPESADRAGMSPIIIAVGAAVVIGIPLLIWAF